MRQRREGLSNQRSKRSRPAMRRRGSDAESRGAETPRLDRIETGVRTEATVRRSPSTTRSETAQTAGRASTDPEVIKSRQSCWCMSARKNAATGRALRRYSRSQTVRVLMPNTRAAAASAPRSQRDHRSGQGAAQSLELPDAWESSRTAGANRTKIEIKRDYDICCAVEHLARSDAQVECAVSS